MFSIIFNVSAAARKTAFERDGQIWPETLSLQINPVELTPEQRTLIANEIGIPTAEGKEIRATGKHGSLISVDGRDLPALITAIAKEFARKKEEAAKEAETKAAKLQQSKKAANEYLAGGLPSLYLGYREYPSTGDAELDAAVLAEKARREEKTAMVMIKERYWFLTIQDQKTQRVFNVTYREKGHFFSKHNLYAKIGGDPVILFFKEITEDQWSDYHKQPE